MEPDVLFYCRSPSSLTLLSVLLCKNRIFCTGSFLPLKFYTHLIIYSPAHAQKSLSSLQIAQILLVCSLMITNQNVHAKLRYGHRISWSTESRPRSSTVTIIYSSVQSVKSSRRHAYCHCLKCSAAIFPQSQVYQTILIDPDDTALGIRGKKNKIQLWDPTPLCHRLFTLLPPGIFYRTIYPCISSLTKDFVSPDQSP